MGANSLTLPPPPPGFVPLDMPAPPAGFVPFEMPAPPPGFVPLVEANNHPLRIQEGMDKGWLGTQINAPVRPEGNPAALAALSEEANKPFFGTIPRAEGFGVVPPGDVAQLNTVIGALNFLQSPKGVMTLPLGGMGRVGQAVLGGMFAPQMAQGAGDLMGTASVTGDPEMGMEGALQGLLAAVAGTPIARLGHGEAVRPQMPDMGQIVDINTAIQGARNVTPRSQLQLPLPEERLLPAPESSPVAPKEPGTPLTGVAPVEETPAAVPELQQTLEGIVGQLKGDMPPGTGTDAKSLATREPFARQVNEIVPDAPTMSGTLLGFASTPEVPATARIGWQAVVNAEELPRIEQEAAKRGLGVVRARVNEQGKWEATKEPVADPESVFFFIRDLPEWRRMQQKEVVAQPVGGKAGRLQMLLNAEKAGPLPPRLKAELDALRAQNKAAQTLKPEEPATLGKPEYPLSTGPEGLQDAKGRRVNPQHKLYSGLFFLDPDFWSSGIGLAKDAKVAAGQLYNRIRNKLGEKSAAWEMLDTPEFRERMKAGAVTTVGEVEKWVAEKGPRVEVRKFGKNVNAAQNERLVENLLQRRNDIAHQVETAGYRFTDPDHVLIQGQPESLEAIDRGDVGVPREHEELFTRLYEADHAFRNARGASNRDARDTAHWSSVAPKPESDMPGYVELAVVKPGKKRVKITNANLGEFWNDSIERLGNEQFQFPSSHSFPPNTLVFVRGYMETLPSGEKAFHVIEVQSDWAQEVREAKEEIAMFPPETSLSAPSLNAERLSKQNDPLLSHYERLGLKAAIDHAREQGATKIIVQDAESAMLMEGHDLHRTSFGTEKEAVDYANKNGGNVVPRSRTNQDPWSNTQIIYDVVMPQEPGMRLHYDRTLPKIAEELTGSKGEKVSLGEHKMAFAETDTGQRRPLEGRPGREEMVTQRLPRENLIFRNPDGTPKTDVSGVMYDISGAKENFSLTGSDKPKVVAQKPPGIGTGMKAAVEKNKESGALANLFGGRPPASAQPLDQMPVKFKSPAEEKAAATTPLGIGKIKGLSRLFDPRSYRNSPTEQAILTNNYLRHKGDTAVALWQETFRDAKRTFKANQYGVVPMQGGAGGYISDIIEAEMRQSGSQPLTPEQRSFVELWRRLHDDAVAEATREGVKFFLDDQGNARPLDVGYFPRPAIGKQGVEATKPAGGSPRPGGKQSHEKPRKFESEREGVAAGIKYEPDEYHRIATWLRGIYNAIADTRLANDPDLGGRPGTQPAFMTEAQVHGVPAFRNRVFDVETAKKVQRYYDSTAPSWIHSLASVNDFIKAFKFTMDTSAPFNQGLPMMNAHPVRWARATLMSYRALLDSNTLNSYLKKADNLAAAREFVSNGGSLVRLDDFLSGAQKGKLAYQVPPVRASARSMGTFLSLAKIELWKAYKPIAEAKGWSKTELAEAIENMVLSGRMEQIGVTPGRALGERLLINAPSYLRGFANLTAMAGQGKISTRVAFRALASLAAGVTLISLAAYEALNLSEEETKDRMTPGNPNFLRVPVKMANGDTVEVSFGNIALSVARLAGDTVEIATGKQPLKPGVEGNPWLRWASYRKSPVVDLLWQMATGKNFRGKPISMTEAVLRSLVPISAEPMAGEGSVKTKAVEAGVQFAGGSAFQQDMPFALRRITAAARQWKRKEKVPENEGFIDSPYLPLVNALRKGQMEIAKTALDKLRTERKEFQIEDYFNEFARKAYTGSKEREERFVESLTTEDRSLYQQVQESNEQVAERFFELTGGSPRPYRPQRPRRPRE